MEVQFPRNLFCQPELPVLVKQATSEQQQSNRELENSGEAEQPNQNKKAIEYVTKRLSMMSSSRLDSSFGSESAGARSIEANKLERRQGLFAPAVINASSDPLTVSSRSSILKDDIYSTNRTSTGVCMEQFPLQRLTLIYSTSFFAYCFFFFFCSFRQRFNCLGVMLDVSTSSSPTITGGVFSLSMARSSPCS